MFKYIFLMLIFSFYYSSAQTNLVPNGGFEDTIACPSNTGELYKLTDWFVSLNTPDYFNTCSIYMPQFHEASVPQNGFGFQTAHSGNGYAGFYTTTNSLSNLNYREIIGIQLFQPLAIGSTYYFSASVSPGFGGPQSVFTFSNNIGFQLSSAKYNYPLNPIPINNNSIQKDSTIISDTLNWTSIHFSFVADSAYTYLYIGNFYNSANTDTIQGNIIQGQGSYYFIDNVCLSDLMATCPTVNMESINIKDNSIRIYPNPTYGIIHVITKVEGDYSLVDFQGTTLNKYFLKNESNELDLNYLSAGLYFLKNNNSTVLYKLIKY